MKKKILMIDDEPQYLISHQEALEDEGYQVRRISNVGEALDTLSKEEFDLLILDLLMPPVRLTENIAKLDLRQTGIKLHAEIRSNLNISVPLIFMSVVRDESIWNKIKAQERKFGKNNVSYLRKPPSIFDLLAIVHELLD